MMPTGSSTGARIVRATQIAADEKRRAEERRRRQHQPVIGADEQPHQVRDDDADEADRAAERHRRAGRERGAEERHALRAWRRRRRATALSAPSDSRFSAAAASANIANATTIVGSAARIGW